jgi:hypothetical protein
MEWKWTKGEPYERSRRLKNIASAPDNVEKEHSSKEIENSAYTSSLNYDENTWDILNQSLSGGFTVSNKREDLDLKIADRKLVQQRGFNPFLSENDYVNDIAIRDQFLKPINTTSDRVSDTNDK